MPSTFQLAIFAVIIILIIFILYPMIVKKLNRERGVVKILEENYLNIEFVLDIDIDGEVLRPFKGSYWTFKNKNEPLKTGERVKIVKIDGNKLIIDKTNKFKLGERGSL